MLFIVDLCLLFTICDVIRIEIAYVFYLVVIICMSEVSTLPSPSWYVCIHVYIYIYIMYIYIYIYMCMYVYVMYMCIHLPVYVYIYVYISLCIYVYIYIYHEYIICSSLTCPRYPRCLCHRDI